MGESGPSAIGCNRRGGHGSPTPEQAQKVVRVSNIGKLSLGLQQPVNRLSLQARRMTDDDRGAAVAAGGRPGSVLCGAKLVRQEKEIRR